MGFVSKIFGGLMGGGKPKAPQPVAPKPAEPTPDQLYGTEEERKAKSRLALNAGGSDPASLGTTSPANVTRRNLLGV